MTAVLAIAWALGLVVSILSIYMTWGNAMMVAMFPEGRRWWMPWSRIATLTVFALLVLAHPFAGAGQ